MGIKFGITKVQNFPKAHKKVYICEKINNFDSKKTMEESENNKTNEIILPLFRWRLSLIIKTIILVLVVIIKFVTPENLKEYINDRIYTNITFYLNAILFYVIGSLSIYFTKTTILLLYIRKNKITTLHNNFVIGVNQIFALGEGLAVFFAILLLFGINAVEFFTSISIFAAALALLFKDYISNMINGMIMMFANEISIGDYVRIGLHKGRIMDITLRNIHIATDDDEVLFLPNNVVFTNEIVNYSRKIGTKESVEFEMDYAYLDDIRTLEEYLSNALQEYEQYLDKDSFNLKTAELRKDYALLKFQFNLVTPDLDVELKIRRIVARKVVSFMRDKNKSLNH
ncbi:MAG: mechanosensitive ion channel protein MscS [Cytophagales bacterium]|nr:MAG: mechanosensitive ion channel protein MscS [Cytophagales bacterium]